MAPPWQNLLDILPWRRARSSALAPVSTTDILRANYPDYDLSLKSEPLPIVPGPRARPVTTGQEFGTSGTENFGGYIRREDYNPELDNFVTAVRIYDKMRKGDAQIKAMMSVLKLPLRGATWTCLPAEGGDGVDEAIAEFINSCVFEDDAMEFSWDFTLRHILLQLDAGFSVLEKIWKVDEVGAYRLLRLAPRLPKTIRQWHVNRNGRLQAVVQYAPVPISTSYPETMPVRGGVRELPGGVIDAGAAVSPVRYTTTVSFQYLTIPAEYLAVFTLEREGDNFEGVSILRSIYRNWFYKDQAYHAEGVRINRFGVGTPVAELEENHNLNQGELDALKDTLEHLKSNESSFLIAPPHVKYDLLPKTGSQTAGTGAEQWINHHDQQIARNVLAGFLTLGNDPHGTLGFGSRLTDMFISSLNGIAAGICADLKHQVVRPLCDLNFDMTKRKYPRVTCRDLEQVDLGNLVETLAVLANTWVKPDDDTERLLRKLLQLPPLAHTDTRNAAKEDAKKAAETGAPLPSNAQNAAAGAKGAPRVKVYGPTDAPPATRGPGMSDTVDQPTFEGIVPVHELNPAAAAAADFTHAVAERPSV
jgi:hypothetical protein